MLTDAPDTAVATDSTKASNRRMHSRHSPQTRAAVWFNIGMDIGELCAIKDLSLTGFGVTCDEWQFQEFLACNHPIYCVILLGEAHFGCMVRKVEIAGVHAGRMGFCFDAIPESSIRLVQGLIDFMAAIEADPELESAGVE